MPWTKRLLPWLIGLSWVGLGASDLSKLPEWARGPARAAEQERVPEGADAWVLLNRTEIGYGGDGEVRIHRLRLVKVLGERGISEGAFTLGGLGGGASKVKSLKGWNLRSDGELVKLDQDTVVTLDADLGTDQVSTAYMTSARLPRVGKESLVAFESLQVFKNPIGPVDDLWVMETAPIRRWELEIGEKESWFVYIKPVPVRLDLIHFSPWIPSPEVVPGLSVCASNVPALPKDEERHPDSYNVRPRIQIRFMDPDLVEMPTYQDWDGIATWTCARFLPRCRPTKVVDTSGMGPVESLRSVHHWITSQLTYKQVYLTPERGWIPEPSEEVVRRRYGDCKDLTACFLGEAKGLGFEVYPALARIVEGVIEPADPIGPVFNHVIGAVKIDHTLGLPAEVATPQGRFLLVDATGRMTPLGWLGDAHRGGRVMICTEKGGLWVQIPDAAILRPATEVRLDAKVDRSGSIEATLQIKETGNAMGLRGAQLNGGRDKLRESLALILDLPPSATMTIVKTGDPHDLGHPLEVEVALKHPDAFHHAGSEATLVDWGLPGIPTMTQKLGKAREYPLFDRTVNELTYTARLELPSPVAPIVPELKAETAFRSIQWEAHPSLDGKPAIDLHFHQIRKPVYFGFAELDKGVSEARKDRRVMQSFHSDALAFKLQP